MKKQMLSLGLILLLFILPINAADQTAITKFDPMGDDSYKLIFENKQGLIYNFPFITNEDNIFKYGNDKRDFVFIEGRIEKGSAITADKEMLFNIGELDYFLLSDMEKPYDENAISHVFRYSGIEVVNNTIEFENIATGVEIKIAFENSSIPGVLGETDLVAAGKSYRVYIANTRGNGNPLAIDMNADGKVNRKEIRMTIASGEVYDLGKARQSDNGDVIKGNNVRVKLLTKKDLFGVGLPWKNEKVFIKIVPQNDEVVWVKSVRGSTFMMRDQGFFRTYYNETFDLWAGSGDVNTLTITSP